MVLNNKIGNTGSVYNSPPVYNQVIPTVEGPEQYNTDRKNIFKL